MADALSFESFSDESEYSEEEECSDSDDNVDEEIEIEHDGGLASIAAAIQTNKSLEVDGEFVNNPMSFNANNSWLATYEIEDLANECQFATHGPANANGEWKGLIFSDKNALLRALGEWHVTHYVQMKVKKSDTCRYTCVCVQSDYRWRLHAHRPKGATYFLVSQYNGSHNCVIPIGTVWTMNPPFTGTCVQQFRRVFWAFGPSIEGWKKCRPVVSVDGTHLYGKYEGCALIATGIDANGGLYPIAFSICDKENGDNWEWFLQSLRDFVIRERKVCIISDRFFGNKEVVRRVFSPDDGHAHQFNRLKEKLKTECENAWKWIEEKINDDREYWALAFDGGRRYGVMTTNWPESLNSVLRGTRSLPVTAFVAATFYRVNQDFVERSEQGRKMTTQLCPKVIDQIRPRKIASRGYQVCRFGPCDYEVNTGTSKYSVTINGRSSICVCQAF
ncbi:uncharacterized protein LOC144551892 [Carex rostrata]